ncbi:hypothetical protein BS50DRAFT_584809 [Corynespora cassiicola Philippines]|uniref:Uncharacterized protein n=1 Tax=Corynespora cassiicola Philippines TaxID=1448308 RepID=A0A2T2P0Y5_CORCC|nr:hypothetical protein BS50DRAFT_584809 [Corynespora cassiicola Philippines]
MAPFYILPSHTISDLPPYSTTQGGPPTPLHSISNITPMQNLTHGHTLSARTNPLSIRDVAVTPISVAPTFYPPEEFKEVGFLSVIAMGTIVIDLLIFLLICCNMAVRIRRERRIGLRTDYTDENTLEWTQDRSS